MNNGAKVINSIEVYEIFKSSICRWNNLEIYRDNHPDNELLAVDLQAGKVGRLKATGIVAWYNARDSKKKNGYIYVPIHGNGKYVVIGVHTIIAICNNSNIFADQLEANKLLLVNHKDNIPWHNEPSNLEWVTYRENSWHGKMVHAIDRFMPSLSVSLTNLSKVEFIGLKEGISAHSVIEWANTLKRKPEKEEGFRDEDVISFLKFLGKL